MVMLRPGRDDAAIILSYVGKVMVGVGLMQLLPAVVALVLRETNSMTALLVGGCLSILVGRLLDRRFGSDRQLDWSHGMVTVALSWLLGPVLAAVPLFLSGHAETFLDAVFDTMSGLTTSGLSVLQDLDHLAASMNLYRHLLHFAGGQGIIIVVLTIFTAAGAHPQTLYVGEGRDERILPNVVRTAQFIYLVASVYLVVGTAALWVAALTAGLDPGRALLHAITLFMAAFDTGGFAPQSSSVAYYHSAAVEAVLMVLMVAGSLSFGLHHALWRRERGELLRNVETRSLALSTLAITALTMLGLARSGAFTAADPLFRKGFFTVLSSHTGTGFAVNAPQLYVSDWGLIAPAAIVAAMALGGMASSTAGGIKAIRIAIAVTSLRRDVRKVLLPEHATVVATIHSRRRKVLGDDEVRAATTTILLFVLAYLGGAIVALFVLPEVDFTQAFFESVSATANVGLSVGITSPEMPALLQVTYILQMWLGRLEFMAVFALVGWLVAAVRRRRR